MRKASGGPSLRALAPAKVNLGLFVGPLREDGRHELATVMQSISLADELVMGPRATDGAVADEVLCPGVSAPNLAASALSAFRAAYGWDAPPVTLRIDKRIPIAAGLAGGSADAAGALRLAAAAAGRGDEAGLLELAAGLGADVPAQVRPGRWLAGGAGERLVALPPAAEPLGVLVLPVDAALATAEVYAEADRLGLERDASGVSAAARDLRAALAAGAALPPAPLLVNDLQEAAVSLCPRIEEALAQAAESGADAVLVSGSGPTVLGLFAGGDAASRVQRTRAALSARPGGAIAALPVTAGFGTPVVAEVRHNLR